MKASGKVNPEKKASFKKTSNFIKNFTFQQGLPFYFYYC